MLQPNPTPIAAERKATTCDFTDRLHQLTHDVRLIELALEGFAEIPSDADREAVIFACRKLAAEIDELADQVLLPESAEVKAILAEARAMSTTPRLYPVA